MTFSLLCPYHGADAIPLPLPPSKIKKKSDYLYLSYLSTKGRIFSIFSTELIRLDISNIFQCYPVFIF